jgi:prepilin-type N-terminal cleavage/methylation domain-containing protein
MIRPVHTSQDGFTLIELMVGMVILIIGVFGLVSAVDGARKLTDVSEHEDVAAQVADRELDQALTLPYNSVALRATPTAVPADAAADATRWNFYLPSANLLPQPAGGHDCSTFWTAASKADANANNETTCIVSCPTADATVGCPSVGSLDPVIDVSVPTAAGSRVRMKVYRYVTWVNDTACGAACPNLADTAYKGDYKRVTIAVMPVVRSVTAGHGLPALNAIGGPLQPIIVSAVKTNPNRGPGNAVGNATPCTGDTGVIVC